MGHLQQFLPPRNAKFFKNFCSKMVLLVFIYVTKYLELLNPKYCSLPLIHVKTAS